jgi:hypothetical protein
MIKDNVYLLKPSDNGKITGIFTNIQEEKDCMSKTIIEIRVWFKRIKRHTKLHS